MFLHNGSDLAEKLHGESNGVGWICKSKEMIVGIVCLVEVLKLNRSDCLTNSIRWVHTKLSKYTSSIYLRRTSDVNGSILISALYIRRLPFVAVEMRVLQSRRSTLSSRVQPGLLVYLGFISGLYQIKMRKLKHQSNYNAMPFASGRGKLNTRTLHSMAYFRAEVHHQRKKKNMENSNFHQRCTFCCFISAMIISNICLFLHLTLNSSSLMRKWYDC